MESKNSSTHRREQIIEIPQINYNSIMEPIHSTRVVRQGMMEPSVVSSVDSATIEQTLGDGRSVDTGINIESVQISGFETLIFETLVSIIILCRNNLEYTKRCIKSIRENAKLNYQLVIVDNGSTDGTSQYIGTVLNEKDILLRCNRNMGFSSGNNLGAKVATGEYLHFLNNDCEVGPAWLEQLIMASEDAGLVGPSLMCLKPDHQDKIFRFGGAAKEPDEWSYLEGWCLLMKKKDFFSLGGFDVQFDPFLSEDADLSFRAKKAAMKLGYVPRLKIKHYSSKTVNLQPDVSEISDRNNKRIYEKWIEQGAEVVKTPCDIIIPTYKNEELTITCFESIKKNTKKETYRIIWVDNGSKDMSGAAKALEGINHIAIYLPVNKGFVGAINTGLAVSDAPTVCLLNNDTVVSDGWLEKLTAVLYSKKEFGIIGPLTGPPAIKERFDSHHNIAYQQRFREVPVFPKFESLNDFNKKIEKQLPGVTGEVDFVAFLCAVIKREVINKVGFLDPNYVMGMWDDADYNMAIKKAGYRVALALDTCILHRGRATFNMVAEQEGFDVPALLKRNRDYLDKKWADKGS